MINPIDTILYTGKTRTTGGRHGQSRSSDDRLVIDLSPLGSNGSGTNPEQLFGAGWSACFLSAIDKAAQASKISLTADTAVDAEIDLGRGGEAFFLAARLKVSLPGVDRAVGQSLIETAHQICPYSKASRGNIDIEITLV